MGHIMDATMASHGMSLGASHGKNVTSMERYTVQSVGPWCYIMHGTFHGIIVIRSRFHVPWGTRWTVYSVVPNDVRVDIII